MTAGAEVAAGVALEVAAGTGDAAPDPAWDGTGRAAARHPRADTLPRRIKVAQPLTLDGSGNGTLVIPGPYTGYSWTVRRLSVLAAAGLSSSMGAATAGIYAGVKGGLIVPANLEWIMSPCPNAATFGTDIFPLAWGEDLAVQIAGGNAGQALIVSVSYQLYGAGHVRNRGD